MLFQKSKRTLNIEKMEKNNIILEVIKELETVNIDLLRDLNSISEMSYYTKLIKNDEKEIEFLKKCYEIDEKGYDKCYSFNWPKGIRYESMNFYWNYSFIMKKDGKIIKTFYTIVIEEDYLSSVCHKVSFIFENTNGTKEVRINELFDIKIENVNSEIDKLLSLEKEDLDLRGQKYKEVPEINFKQQNILIRPNSFDYKVYVELLKMKFKIVILNEILEGKNSCIHIGVEYLDYSSSFKMRGFDLSKRRLNLIIENSDLINLKISFREKIYRLKDILKFLNIETGKKEPWEIFLMFSERDLLILSKVIDKLESDIEYKEKIPYEI